MRLEDSPLNNEIRTIMTQDDLPGVYVNACVLITPEKRIPVLKFFSQDLIRDYTEAYGDQRLIDIMISEAAYTYDLMPHRQQLQVELHMQPLRNTEAVPGVLTFGGVLLREKDTTTAAASSVSHDKSMAGIGSVQRIQLQLLDFTLEQCRTIETGGTYRDTVPGVVARYALDYVSQRMSLARDFKIRGTDVVAFDNQTPSGQMIIPQGTPVFDTVMRLQNEWGGLYNTGCGCYLQNRMWYVWPLYNTRRFESEERVLRVINIPTERYPGLDKTYRLANGQLIVLATGETDIVDRTHHQQLNQGNATRYAGTDQMWDAPNQAGEHVAQVEGNKARIRRQRNNVEYKAIERPNYDVSPVASDRLSNNSFKQASELAPRRGGFIMLTWEHSRPDLVYPGMPTQVEYLRDDGVGIRMGTVVKAHHYTYDTKRGAIAGPQVTTSFITVFIETANDVTSPSS